MTAFSRTSIVVVFELSQVEKFPDPTLHNLKEINLKKDASSYRNTAFRGRVTDDAPCYC
jgi:hypothetical protein